MINLTTVGRTFFSFSIIGMATQQLFYPVFRNLFVPETPSWLANPEIWVYLFSLFLIGSSVMILFGKNKNVPLILGLVFIILFLIAHVPYRLSQDLNNLGVWTIAIKCLTFAGGAFVAAGCMSSAQAENVNSAWVSFSDTLTPVGALLFSLMLIAFGTDHFLYTTGVSRLVPEWIPFKVFWTYFSAVALIGSGTAILFRIRPQLIAILAGIMILIWVFVLHLPGALAEPETGSSHALTSTFHALGFSGIAFMVAGLLRQKPEVLSYKRVFGGKK